MRIFLVIDETNFYLPNYVAGIIKGTDYEFVGCALVTKIPKKSDIQLYLIRNFYRLKILEIIKLIWKKALYLFWDKIFKRRKNGNFYSVRSVLQSFNIPFFEAEYDINKKEYVDFIKTKKPDVILSSNSLIFKEEVLSIPKFCINRHCGLLPSYGGLWPILHAVSNGESYVGAAVHTMERAIDKGVVLSFKEIPIGLDDTIYSLYEKCYELSVSVTIIALKLISQDIDILKLPKPPFRSSYNSFPIRETWDKLRMRKIRFI